MPRGTIQRRIKFTPRGIVALPRPEWGNQADYFDQDLRGFGCRVSYGGKKAWFVMYRCHGRKRRLTIGSASDIPLATARERAKLARSEAAGGVDPARRKIDARTGITFKELAKEYIEQYAKPHKASWKSDQRRLNAYLLDDLGHIKAAHLTTEEIDEVLGRMLERDVPIAANRTLETIRSIYSWATQKRKPRYKFANPAAGIEKPSEENNRKRSLSREQLGAYWAAIEAIRLDPKTSPAIKIGTSVIKCMLLMNQRKNEILHMRYPDIDSDDWWNIPENLTKTKEPYRLPILPPVKKIITEMRALEVDDVWVFAQLRGGKPAANNCVSDAHIAAIRAAGIDDYVPHDNLHTVTSFMSSTDVGIGLSDEAIAKIRHHVPLNKTTARYNHNKFDREKMENLTAWQNWLLEAVGDRRPSRKIVQLRARRRA
jgi:hypothetical protein